MAMQSGEVPLSVPAFDRRQRAFVRWGVLPGPWLWPTPLRVLFVLDGRISTSDDEGAFGLGLVLDTLTDESIAWWVRFTVDVVRRDDGNRRLVPPLARYPEKLNFRFTDSDFRLDDYDQVWFFGDYPANDPGDVNDEMYSPLGDDELKLLAEWMDRGGGVFAAGDHHNLGASMCSRIPRVRTMRRWTESQGVPSQFGFNRNQTLQLQASQGNQDVLEGDDVPQPILPVFQTRATSIVVRPRFPHPLLCAPHAVIDKFPDHMHEGEVVDDDDVELDLPLDIPGYDRREYPFDVIVADPGESAAIEREIVLPRSRPRPHVVAYGQTTNRPGDGDAENDPVVAAQAAARINIFARRFGLISAYDGDRAEIGRVVVDSTWHHWFSLNLHGFKAASPPTVYQLMQAYYRNVGLWLARPAKRQSMLLAATWGTVASDPMAFPMASGQSLWAIGERAVDVVARTATQCTLFDLVASFFGGRAEQIFGVPAGVDPAEPYGASPPVDLAVRAIVGGIAASLLRPALDYHQARGKARPVLDPDAIRRHAAAGIERGHLALVDAIRTSAAASERVVARLVDDFRPLPPESIPIELIALRVVAGRLQLPDPTDPALADGRFSIIARVSLAGSVIASEVIEEIDVPSFEPRGGFIDLDRVLYDGLIQSGESLVVEICAVAAGRKRFEPERLRFTETLEGRPSTWIGPHFPSRNQPWRLWYRIEEADTPHKTP